jgi:cell division protein FtsL
MLKLLLCLFATVITAVCLVELRQQRLEMTHDIDKLHSQIETRQSRLWNQQVVIAADTTPKAVEKAVGSHDLKLSKIDPMER